MVFPDSTIRVTDAAIPIPTSDQFPLDLNAFRKLVLVGQSEQDDATLESNLRGAISHLENELRVSILRSAYESRYDVFLANRCDDFIFLGLDASVRSVTARQTQTGEHALLGGVQTRPYYSNGAVAVSLPFGVPSGYDELVIRGAAGATQATLPGALRQAIHLAFGYMVDKNTDNLEAINTLIQPYRLG